MKKFQCIAKYGDGLEITCAVPQSRLDENVDVWLTEIDTDDLYFLQIKEIKN